MDKQLDTARLDAIQARAEAATDTQQRLSHYRYLREIETKLGVCFPFNAENIQTLIWERADLLSQLAEKQKALDEAVSVLRKLCKGRRCTTDEECPLGTYFDCSVPEMLLKDPKGGQADDDA
jgi:hypothetical protein